MNEMKKDLCSQWEVTDLGEPSKIIGIKITRSDDVIKISQKRSMESILTRQGLEEANPMSTLLDLKVKIEPNPKGNEGDKSNTYAQLLGELQFIANATRPDITYAINNLASYIANPDLKHQIALKCILRYLAGTKNYGITYKYLPNSIPTFQGFMDVAFTDREDIKSTTGYLIKV